MVVIEVRHRQGGEADEEEKEKEEKEEKEEKWKAADIKSNNPHLAGGEKRFPMISPWSNMIDGRIPGTIPKLQLG